MYDWPETSSVLDAFWRLAYASLKTADIDAPATLTREENVHDLWTNRDLLVGQTCGWPYANQLRGKVHPFARFDYGLADCPPGFYRSVFIGQDASDAEYLNDAQTLSTCPSVAINGADSQSGFHVFAEVSGKPADESLPSARRYLSGAHRNSVKAVAEGKARIAAIDAVAFELAKSHETEAVENVVIIGHSTPKPGLPLITSPAFADQADMLFSAIGKAIDTLPEAHLNALHIKGLLPAADEDYEVFVNSQNR